ncbi:MAG TPA: YbaB/EbfC family nucleoid-associated protein [Terriglobales bacterium]|nr:YbaB/EbfC family nucleoid-associated protein [Terriglobales bacterium]
MSKGFDFNNLLEQAQQMQSRLADMQEQAANRTAEANAGGGMVNAVVNGKMEIVSLRIDPQVIATGDLEMLQDLVIAAVNQAIRNVQAAVAEEMQKLTGGLNLPGMTP